MSDQRCGARHPKLAALTCHRAPGHERRVSEQGYLAWHQARDKHGNLRSWKP